MRLPKTNTTIELKQQEGKEEKAFWTEGEPCWLFEKVHAKWTLVAMEKGVTLRSFHFDISLNCLVSCQDKTLYRDHGVEMVLEPQMTEEIIQLDRELSHLVAYVFIKTTLKGGNGQGRMMD